MKTKIFFALNSPEDMYLTSQTKVFLNKNKISYQMDYFDFNFLDIAFGPDRHNLNKLIQNYREEKKILDEISIKDEKIEKIKHAINFLDDLEEYDIYCFSLYDSYIAVQVAIALHLKKKYPKSKILFGGPEIILEESTLKTLKETGFYCSRGDLEKSLLDLIESPEDFNNTNHTIKLNALTKDDVPKYSKDELEYLNYKIKVSASRGCANNCYYCSSPALSSYRLVKREVLVEWIRYYNEIGIKEISFNDSTFNKIDFDYFLDKLIEMKNKITFFKTDLSFESLKLSHIRKMKKAGFKDVAFGIECIHPELAKKMNKKMPSKEKLISYLEEFEKQKINVRLFYIVGIPFQTEKIFEEELKILDEINKRFKNVSFEFYDFFVSPKSYIDKNHKDFNIQKTNNSNINYVCTNPNKNEVDRRLRKLYQTINNYILMNNTDKYTSDL